jgi:hypothetical protein
MFQLKIELHSFAAKCGMEFIPLKQNTQYDQANQQAG